VGYLSGAQPSRLEERDGTETFTDGIGWIGLGEGMIRIELVTLPPAAEKHYPPNKGTDTWFDQETSERDVKLDRIALIALVLFPQCEAYQYPMQMLSFVFSKK